MFQFEDVRSPDAPTRPAQSGKPAPSPPLTHRALLAWGEHCVECAAPACYSSCDLYAPTPSGKCRRIENGIVRNKALGTPDGPGAEVRFKRWGKLEAQGNGFMLPARRARRIEKLLVAMTPPVARVGRLISRVSGQARWATAMETLHKRINDWLQARETHAVLPNAFLLDVYNPTDRPVTLIFSGAVDKLRLGRATRNDQLPTPMSATVTVPAGFSAHQIALDALKPTLQSGLPFNLALTPQGDEGAHLIFKRMDLVTLAEPQGERQEKAAAPAAFAPSAKLVIFDLDNTLWDGVLLEGDVTLRAGVKTLFETLDARGILISVASKNAREDAMARLEALGLADFLLYQQIGWQPKSESVAKIVKALDIGIDTAIFVDDNPFERAEVSAALPNVEVLADTALATLADHPRLQGAVTPESRGRREMYRQAMTREEAAAEYGDGYLDFLRACNIRVQIRPDQPADFERVAELVQRTNQLNFSGRKYSRDEIADILTGQSRDHHIVICDDKFGSYGTVGFCLSAYQAGADGKGAVIIEDFMLSCRVQGKFIEQSLFWFLVEKAPGPVSSIIVKFNKTARNRAAEMVLEKLGFQADAQGQLSRPVGPGDLSVDFMDITG